MPSRIHCPACQAAFRYSPALLGRTVQCKQCSHSFTVSDPPLEEVPVDAAASAAAPVPPPLPARRVSRRNASEVEPREPADRPESDSRRRPVHRDRPGGTAALFGLLAAFIVGFLVLAIGIGYVLWPNGSKSTAPATPGQTATPAVEAPLANERPKPLKDVLKDAPPPQDGGGAGAPMPQPLPKAPAGGNVPRNPRGPQPNANLPAFPPAVPARPAGDGPKFAPLVPLEIKPARLARDRDEVSLPGPVESVAVAGGGRLLLLHIPKVKQVVVFDVSTAKVAKEIAAPDPDTMIAGGMNFFIIYQPGKNAIERWSCDKFERQPDIKSPFSDPVKALAMGASSNGPLVAALGGNRATKPFNGATLAFVDPTTLKELDYQIEPGSQRNLFGLGLNNGLAAIRVSANGSVTTGWTAGSHSGCECHVITGRKIRDTWSLIAPHPLLPVADGRALLGRGVALAPELRGGSPPGPPIVYVPAAKRDWYLAIRGPDLGVGDDNRAVAIGIIQIDKDSPAATFENVDDVDLSRAEQGLDQSVILVLDAQVLITVAAPKRSKLVLRRVELK